MMYRPMLSALMGVVLLASTTASAITPDEIMNMVNVNVPVSIVVATIDGSGTRFTPADIARLRQLGAPPEVMAAATRLSAGGAPTSAPVAPAPVSPSPVPAIPRPAPVSPDDEMLGSDLRSSGSTDAADDDVGGAGPDAVEQLVTAYKAKKYLTASKGLYDLLQTRSYPEHETKITYYLAKSLFDLEMYHGAQHYFKEVVRRGPRNPYFKYALPRLVAIADLTGNDTELLRFVDKIPPEAFPRQARNHLFYLLGRNAYEREELSEGARYFGQISAQSELYMRAKYFEGVIQYQREKQQSAVRAFREVYQAEPQVSSALAAQDVENLKDLALLNIARVYFKLERYDNASTWYELVDRGSRYWPQSLYENAWSHLHRGEINKVLGLLLTARSPFYTTEEFNPEATLVRALGFFTLCEFNDADRVLTEFEREYNPMAAEIKSFLDSYASEQGRDLADQAFDTYFSKAHTKSTLSKSLFTKALRNRDLASLVRHMDLMDAEVAAINAQKGVWNESLGDGLKKIIEADRQRYKKRAGLVLLQTLADEYRSLSSLISQSEIIRFEIVDAQRVDYEYQLSSGDIGVQKDTTLDFATSREIIYWPFNGEFWKDELGYYRYTEKGSCK